MKTNSCFFLNDSPENVVVLHLKGGFAKLEKRNKSLYHATQTTKHLMENKEEKWRCASKRWVGILGVKEFPFKYVKNSKMLKINEKNNKTHQKPQSKKELFETVVKTHISNLQFHPQNSKQTKTIIEMSFFF